MSDEKNPPLEFSAFDLMPEWAQESKQSSREKGSQQQQQQRRSDRGDKKRSSRGHRGGGGGDYDRRGRSDRGSGGGGFRGGGGRGDRRNQRGGNQRGSGGRGGNRRNQQQQHREDFQIKGVKIKFEPTEESIKSLAKHIRDTVRVYPMADLAKMVVNSRDRYQIRLKREKNGPKLFQCREDGSVWLSKEEAVSHFLKLKGVAKYYDVEEVDLGPPKGNFANIAVCGFSGEILGPPNHHEYQNVIARIHREKFSNMSIERYKSRIEMRNDEETLQEWQEKVSKAFHYRLASEKPEETEAETPSGEVEEKPEEKSAEPVSEEAVVEEPTSDEPTSDEPTSDEPTSDEPTSDEPTSDEPTSDEPTSDEPTSDEPTSDEPTSDEPTSDEPTSDEPTSEPPPSESEFVLKTPEELQRHFRENFADQEIAELNEIVVPGNIPGRQLSGDLLQLIKTEGNKLRRGFPFDMFQSLCNRLEKEGLKFFKRGKKALHVALVRPQAVNPNLSLTERIEKIIKLVSDNPKILLVDVLEKMCPDFKKPDPKDKEAKIELSDDAKSVLGDVRWLTFEGFVLEFPDTRLELGKKAPSEKSSSASPAPAKKAKPTPTPAKKAQAKKEPSASPPSDPKPKPKSKPEPGQEPEKSAAVSGGDDVPVVEVENAEVPVTLATTDS